MKIPKEERMAGYNATGKFLDMPENLMSHNRIIREDATTLAVFRMVNAILRAAAKAKNKKVR